MLMRGYHGPEVLDLIMKLQAYGLKLTCSQSFNLTVEAAVRIFQAEQGLGSDGIAGPLTLGALQRAQPRHQGLSPIKVVHRAEYLSQRDNLNHPFATCGPTSCCTVMQYLGAQPKSNAQLEDDFYDIITSPSAQAVFNRDFPWAVGKYNTWNIHGMLRWTCEQFDFKDSFRRRTWTEIENWLQTVGPIVISGGFTGYGHIVCLVGLTARGDAIIHDPYGDWEAGYHTKPNGAFVIYNKERLRAVLSPTADHPYCHFISR